MADPTHPSPVDDFGVTSLDRTAMTFDEAGVPSSDAPPSSDAVQPQPPASPRRQLVGPAWAGTLPGVREELAARPAMPTVAAATPVQAPMAAPEPAEDLADPADFAKTTVHQRAHPAPTGAPVQELHADGDRGSTPRGLENPAEDRLLKIALVIVAALIAIVFVALVVGIAVDSNLGAETLDAR